MKQSLILGFAGAALLLSGCNDDRLPGAWTKSTGGIAPTVSVDASVSTASRALRTADAIEAADLSLRLVSADGSLDRVWDKVADFDPEEEFAVGDYTMYAFYGDSKQEGFEVPFYQGSTSLSVRENRTTPVAVTAGLANTMVSIAYTDAFKGYMTDWSAELTSSAGTNTVVYGKDETRAAYLVPGTVALKVNFTKPNGVSATALAATINAQARHHYSVTVNVNDGGVGDAVLTITYVDDVDGEIEIPIDLSDKIISAAAPEVTTVGFASGDVIKHVESSEADQSLKANIVARGGLASVVLSTESASLRGQGWPAEIDLMAADAATQATLTNLGLGVLGLYKNPDKMAVVDFTKVLEHLAITASDVKESTFALTVTDRYTKQSEPVSFTVSLIKLELVISGHGAMLYDADNVDLTISYNGTNPEKDLGIQAKNARGSWDDLTINSISAAGEGVYTVNVKIPAAEKAMTFRAVSATGLVSNEIEVPVGGIKLMSTSANTFATYAYLEADGDIEDGMTFEYSADGGSSYQAAQATPRAAKSRAAQTAYKIAGLPAGSTLLVRAKTSQYTSNPVEITTEEAAQLPNGKMDAEATIEGSASNWENYVFAGGWGTNNAMTTSQGSNFGYVRISGTKPTDDSRSGKAVAIRTNGWGSNNSALSGVSGKCKYIDAGLLHLGATRTTRPEGFSDISGSLDTDDLDCGISFGSRPSGLSFYYKYAAKNSADHGEALVRVLDESGNVICEAKTDLGSASGSGYGQAKVMLEYPADAPKAGKIYVRFLSTNVADALKKDGSWLNGPGWGNLSRGEYSGSTLYIDDVELIY